MSCNGETTLEMAEQPPLLAESNGTVIVAAKSPGVSRKALVNRKRRARQALMRSAPNWISRCSKTSIDLLVSGAGCCSNIATKGTMKAVGFIVKKIIEDFNASPITGALFSATMHLVFNVFSIGVIPIFKRFGYLSTILGGGLFIVLSLLGMSLLSLAKDNVTALNMLVVLLATILGLGCAMNYHAGVSMLNGLVNKGRNACSNGLSLAGNTVGAIAFMLAISYLFEGHDPVVSFTGLAGIALVFLLIGAIIYIPPQIYVWKEEETSENDLENEKAKEGNAKKSGFDSIYWTPKYVLLCMSQALNAIGFLNLTGFFNMFLKVEHGYDDKDAAKFLITVQMFDLFGRLIIPMLTDLISDRFIYARHLVYMTGTIGTGACMFCMDLVRSEDLNIREYQLYGLCAAIGIFSSCFIALWNSVVKAESATKDEFNTIYSHSLAFTGIVQLVVTMITVYGLESGANLYKNLLKIFGVFLMTSAAPIVLIIAGDLLDKITLKMATKPMKNSEA